MIAPKQKQIGGINLRDQWPPVCDILVIIFELENNSNDWSRDSALHGSGAIRQS